MTPEQTSPELRKYLAESYRRDVLGEVVPQEWPVMTPALWDEVNAVITSIDELRLGAHLANRDFASYQHRRALVRLKLAFEGGQDAAGAQQQSGSVQAERLDADGGGGSEPPRTEPETGVGDSLRDTAPGE